MTRVNPKAIAKKLGAEVTAGSKAISAFDARLLNGAARGLSPNELSRLVGGTVSPAEAAVRVREMLADKNFWSSVERKQLLLHRIHKAVEDIAERADQTKDSKDFGALIRALDLLRKSLAEMDGATEAEMAAMVRMQAADMMDYMDALMRRAREILADEYPDFNPDVIEEAIELAREDVRSSS